MKTASKVVSFGNLSHPKGYLRAWIQLENGYSFILSEDGMTNHPNYCFTQNSKTGLEISASWDEDFGSVWTDVREPRMLCVNLYGSHEAFLAFEKEMLGK